MERRQNRSLITAGSLPVHRHAPHQNLLIRQDNLTGLADTNGRMLILPRFETVTDLGTGYALVQRDGKYGVLTTQGGVSTIPLMYDYIRYDPNNQIFLALQRSPGNPSPYPQPPNSV